MNVKLNFRQFSFPNFLTADVKSAKDGKLTLDICEVLTTDEEAKKYWNDLRDEFVEHVRQRRLSARS